MIIPLNVFLVWQGVKAGTNLGIAIGIFANNIALILDNVNKPYL